MLISHRANAILLMLILAVGIGIVAMLGSRAYGGPLDPSGAPASTGHSLDDIAPVWDSQLSSAGGCSSARFKCVLGGAAVLDRETGIVWETAPGSSPGDWFAANALCNGGTMGGRGGWRLPDLREFMSLVDQTQSNPPLPTGHPFTVSSNTYWTSSELSTNTATVSTISLGAFSLGSLPKGSVASAWCVRGAPVQGGGGAATPSASPTPVTGDTCTFASAATLSVGTLSGQTTTGCGIEVTEPAPSCAPAGTHSRWYTITVPSGQLLSLTAAPDDTLFDPAVAVFTGPTLGSLIEAACANAAGAGAAEATSVANSTGAPITYYLRVDSNSTGNSGAFGIIASLGSPPPGCTFGTATALSLGLTSGQTTVGCGREAGEPSPSCAPAGTHSRWYAIVVPAGQQLALTIAPIAVSFDAAVAVYTGSSLVTLVESACANFAGAGGAEAASLTNSGGSPVTYQVRVDSSSATNSGTFDITAGVASPAPGCTFGTALSLSAGLTSGQTTAGCGNEGGEPPLSCAPAGTHSRWYAIVVPAGKQLTVTVTATSGSFNPALGLYTGATLGALAEVVCANSTGGGGAETGSTTNATGIAVTYKLKVDSPSATSSGPFTVNVTIN